MRSKGGIELVYVEHEPAEVRRAIESGICTFLVDRECRGKERRQSGRDTEIAPASLDELRTVAGIPGARAWCRINSFGDETEREIESAIDAGAVCIFLPMVTSVADTERFLALLGGRCEAAILVETCAAVRLSPELGRLPLDRVYLGLNDLAIDRGAGSIFDAVGDGTVERVRRHFPRAAFGFAGLTDTRRGDPIPAHLLTREIHRLDCSFSFCRRSFRRDTRGRDMAVVVAEIETFFRALGRRSAEKCARDHADLLASIERESRRLCS